jgi:hypothetical protein
MSSRTRANADRRRAKKVENQLNFGTSAAKSETLIETCMKEIVRVTRQALEYRDEYGPGPTYRELKACVNGLVWMYCKVWVNPYELHMSAAVKSVRREAVKRAREEMGQ